MTQDLMDELLTAAMVLERASIVSRLSRMLTATASAVLLLFPVAGSKIPRQSVVCAAIMLCAGAFEAYFAIRVAFDAALFRRSAEQDDPQLLRTDAALRRLNLRRSDPVPRSVGSRFAGAKRLFFCQALACIAQVASAVFAGLAA